MRIQATIACLTVLLSTHLSAQTPTGFEATIMRWSQINSGLTGNAKLQSERQLSRFRREGKTGVTVVKRDPTGRGRLGSTTVENGAGQRTRGRKPNEKTFLYVADIVRFLNYILFLCNDPSGPGDPDYECMYKDMIISTLQHELKHAYDQTGTHSQDSNEWECQAYCCEVDFWCNQIMNDPQYGVGGAKQCFGQAMKIDRHSKKDAACFLAGP